MRLPASFQGSSLNSSFFLAPLNVFDPQEHLFATKMIAVIASTPSKMRSAEIISKIGSVGAIFNLPLTQLERVAIHLDTFGSYGNLEVIGVAPP